MKKMALFFLVSTCLTSVFSQNISSQHSIFGIEDYRLTEDFNLKKTNNITPVEVYQYQTYSLFGKQTVEELSFNFNNLGLLTSKTYVTNDAFAVDKYKKTTYSYKGSKLAKVNNTNKDNKPTAYFPEIIYNYDSNGKLIKALYTIRFLSQKTEVYTYNPKNNSALRYRYDGTEEEYKFDKKGLIVEKKTTKSNGQIGQSTYAYNNGLMTSFKSVSDVNKNNTSAQPTRYVYNENNDVVKESSGYLSDTFFSYVYDDYNNWVARYNTREDDLKKNIVIRQITYSNGKVTGFRTTTDGKLLDAVKKQKQETVIVSNRNVPKNGIFWEKNEDGSIFNIYINGAQLKGAKGAIRNYLVENDVLVFDTKTKRLYKLENYKPEKPNAFHKVIEETLSNNVGYWVKTSDGGALVFDLNGDEINFEKDFVSSDFIEGDLVSTKANGEKWVFKDSKNVPKNKIFPIVKFGSSKGNDENSVTSKITNKPYEEELDYTWKKNEAGAYWFYKSNNTINNTKNFWKGSDLLVLDHTNNTLVNLRGYKQGEPNVTYKGYKINVDITDGFWYKIEGNQFRAYDKRGNQVTDLEVNKWSDDKKSLTIKSKNSSQTYVLPEYAEAEMYKVNALKVEGYEKSVSNVYNDLAESMKNQLETTKSVAESTEKILKNLLGECFKGNCEDGYGEKKWPSGNVAEAFFEKGKPFGPGLITLKDGNQQLAIYKGSWDDVEGLVYTYFKDKASQFVNYKTKKGLYYDFKSKELWELNDEAKTKTLLEPNNDNYCLVGNCQNGVGLYKYNNGAVYMGTFNNGRRHGFGELSFPDGQFYLGEFVYDKKEGLGTYVWSEDKNYTGEWRNDTYHGKGIMSYSKTNYQAGLWESGKYLRSLDSKN